MSSSLESRYETAVDAVAAIPMDAVAYTALTDASLIALARRGAELERSAGAHAALIAGELARRSAPSLGHAGLAASSGFRTPAELVQSATGGSVRDAVVAVRVGLLAHSAAGTACDERQWLGSVGAAIVGDGLSVASAESISSGLGSPTASVPADVLGAAAAQLCAEAASLDADQLFRRARQLRDELDVAGIAEREDDRREQRALRLRRQPNGMSRLTWELDPESAALVGDLYDRATSPRRGGPRFVDPDAASAASRIADDARTTEQLASDVFLNLLRVGSDADSSQLLGSGAPSVRVIVTEAALRSRSGSAFIEGQADPVSIETAERLACTGSTLEVRFASGQPLDVGREHRLYTARQRIALAVRDGGCRWPGCDRPPSWTEAHHINHWARDGGRTDVADGVLLCRYHHLLAHNNGWEIRREGSDYWLVPPPGVAGASADAGAGAGAAQHEISMPARHRFDSVA